MTRAWYKEKQSESLILESTPWPREHLVGALSTELREVINWVHMWQAPCILLGSALLKLDNLTFLTVFKAWFWLVPSPVTSLGDVSGTQLCKELLLSIEVGERSGRCSNYSEVFTTILRRNSIYFPRVFPLLCLWQ